METTGFGGDVQRLRRRGRCEGALGRDTPAVDDGSDSCGEVAIVLQHLTAQDPSEVNTSSRTDLNLAADDA